MKDYVCKGVEVLATVILVFKTNVASERDAIRIVNQLIAKWPDLKINFDLDDCDNILRIESFNECLEVRTITQYLKKIGYSIEELT